jgi:AraC-like DNA-binding protein
MFDSPVFDDPSLARRLLRSHARLSRPGGETDRSQDGELLVTFEALQRWHRRAPDESWHEARRPVAVVREYLHDHYAERIRLECLAKLVGLSVFHLIRIFRTDTGLSPYAYLGQVRVHRAAELLRAGMSASMVASATGFADQSHLTRLFKRLVGVPPGAYQRACRVQEVRGPSPAAYRAPL